MIALWKYERTEGNVIVDTAFVRLTDEQQDFFAWLEEKGGIDEGVTLTEVIIEDLT